MNIHREFWEKGTHILLSSGNRYEISGLPIGTGGGSIIYPAYRLVLQTNGTYKYDGIHYALKECFPHSHEYEFSRNSSGTVIPLEDSKEAWDYLNHVKQMQLHEKDITQKIYQTGSRLLPIRESAEHFFVEKANLKTEAELIQVDNCITVMDSLASKGRSLESYIQEYEKFTVLQTFEIIHQVLLAVKEIHQSEFLHLDIQSGNIYIKGSLENENDIVTMIDFGSARHLINGKTEPITDRVIFTTEGFSAPEILSQNNGFLQLGPEADIYSIGVLILYMLTGTRYDSATLLNNQTGKYLSRFKLRKIDCPKHLIDGMQDIIAHALAANPENRYHSADEMLKDVAILIKELQPICGHLDFILYDAFICYRHSTLDSKAAKAIQERLEHFRVPKGFSEQRHPFRRVFLDEGELSSCADFGKMIDTALKNSSWLIVICSPDTPFSNWVNVEIETFLKYHDRSKILTVLVEGTPDTSFPDILKGDSNRNNGVFAADVRGTTESQILKKIRGDSLLRITAPMLGTTYDALKQRHKVYKRKRTFTLAGVLGLFLVAFSIYAFKQNFLLEKERSNANANQLQYTIESAKNQLSTNRPKAIKTLLDGFGDDKNTESLGAEAECTLTKAVNAYSTPYSEQSPVLSTTFETPATDEFELTEIYSDPEHNVLIGYDLCHIYFWDTESGSLLKELSVTEFHDSQLKCREDWIYPEKNLLFFYTDSGKFYCYDYLHNIVKWSFSSKKYSIYDPSAAICKSSNTFILIFDSQVIEVDISNGNIVSEISTAQEYPYIHLMNNFTISETCNTLAIYAGTFDSAQEDEIIKYGRYCTKKEDNIILYNLKTHSCEMIPLETYDIGSADTDLIITNRQLLIGIVPSKTDEVSSSRHNEITLISVNLKNNEIFWKSTIDFSHSIVNKEDSLNKDYFCSVNLYVKETANGSTVLLSSYENCVRINVKDGAVEKQWKFSDSITSILINEYGYYAITKDGVVYNTRWYKDEGDIFTDFQEDPNLCIFDGESIIIHFYNSPLKMYTLAYDPSYKKIVNTSVSDTYDYYIANCYSDENYFVTINVRELLLDGRSHSGEGYQIEWYEIEKQQNKKVHQLKLTEGLFSPEVTGIFDINGIQKIVLLSEYCANTENAEYNYELIFIDPKTEKVEYHHIPHADIMIAISNYENMLYYLCKENSGECTLYSLTLGSSVSKKLLSLKCNTEITYTTIAVDNTGKEILFSMDNRLYLYNVLKNKIAWEKDLSDYKLSGIITYQWSKNSKLFWVVSEENISFFDSNGGEKYRIPATLLDDTETINILKEDCCFWNGKEYCYYLYPDLESNTTTLYKISLSDASIMEAVTISTQDGIASLEYMNDTLLMISVSNQTILVDIADENLEIRALLPYIDCYDKINNRFYIRTMLNEQIEEIGDTNNYTGSHEYEWGYFPRHSVQELLEIGKSIIKNY